VSILAGLIVPEEHWEMFSRTLPQQNHSAAMAAEKAAAENAGFNQANFRVVFSCLHRVHG
jgi:hypothetical protein